MAVELRCPDCRAKLRLPEAPEAGTEVECPKCAHVFAAPDPDTGEAPDRGPKKRPRPADEDDDRPRKKKKPPADEDGGEDDDAPPPKKPAAADKGKAGKKPGGEKSAKRRQAKKKETNPFALYALVAGGVVFLVVLIGLLVWFFNRKPVSYEMIAYLPADSTSAAGLNIGHMQKYPEFYKVLEPALADLGWRKAADAVAAAAGADPREFIDSFVQGGGKSGGAIVLRTKKEFDASALAKLPGAQAGSADGQKYYTVGKIDKLWGDEHEQPRVFAPTGRLVVFCSGKMAEATFRKVIGGNKDDFDNTIPGKYGPLAKRTMKGTYWAIMLLDQDNRPKAPEKKADGASGGEVDTQVATSLSSAKAFGFKAGLGSKAVRFEVLIQCRDAEDASNAYQKYKESDLAKGDEAEPPRWWKEFAQSTLSNKKLGIELLSNLGAKASGEVFLYYSECDTRVLMEVVASLAGKITGPKANTGGGAAAAPAGVPAPK